MARVLVTRPEPGASATARRLNAQGHDAVVLPLSEIRPLNPALPDPAGIDAVAATSANAFRHIETAQAAPLLAKPCFTVGERTALAAQQAGFSDMRRSDADGSALARLIARQLPPGSRIVYLCGRVRRPEFEAELRAAGMICHPVELYDAVLVQPDSAATEALLASPPDAILIYSRRAAEALREMMSRPPLASGLEAARLLCLSEAVARGLGTVGVGRTYWSKEPNEDALFTLLPDRDAKGLSKPAAHVRK